MPDPRGPGPHSRLPSTYDLRELLQRLRRSDPLESIPGLSLTKPVLDEEHEIIQRFDVTVEQRPDRERLPCALCSNNKPKFLHGFVLWSGDGWLRIIGSCCGPKYFGVHYHEMTRRMAKRFSNERAENYLWENLPKIAGVIAKTKLLSDRCLMCDERMKKIREDAPEAVKSIVANANENDGRLCVVHKISGAGPRMKTTAGGSDFQTMTIAPLRGEKALKDKKPLNTYRKNILLILAKLPSISNDDELLEVITDLSTDPQKLRNYADAVMGAFKKVDDLHGRISEAESFFSRENMIGIMKWSDDLESHAGFDLKIQGKSVVIKSNNETCVVKMLS